MRTSSGVIIVGASIAGFAAAEALRARGHDAPITLIGDEAHLPYSRPPLSKRLLEGESPVATPLVDHARLAELRIDFAPGTRVESAMLHEQRVVAAGHEYHYDMLIAATGCVARRMPQVPSAHVMRTLEDAQAIRARLASAEHVSIIGGGVLACELASAARAHGVEATIIARGSTLALGSAGGPLSTRVEDLLNQNGVDIKHETSVTGSSEAGTRTLLALSDGSEHEADLVLVAIGASPTTDWLENNGLDLSDGVLCDPSGRFAPHAYAVGDVARWRNPVTGRAQRHEHQTNALEQAATVAEIMTGGTAGTPMSQFFWSEMFGTRIQVRGEVPATATLWTIAGEESGQRMVLGAHDGRSVRGIVGWNMAREFRGAWHLVGTAIADVPHALGRGRASSPRAAASSGKATGAVGC